MALVAATSCSFLLQLFVSYRELSKNFSVFSFFSCSHHSHQWVSACAFKRKITPYFDNGLWKVSPNIQYLLELFVVSSNNYIMFKLLFILFIIKQCTRINNFKMFLKFPFLLFCTSFLGFWYVISNLRKITSKLSVFNIETSYIAKVCCILIIFCSQ